MTPSSTTPRPAPSHGTASVPPPPATVALLAGTKVTNTGPTYVTADIGSATITGDTSNIAVRIASDMRGRRYGEQLIAWAVQRCRERDCFLVQLTSSNPRTDAHRFYERLGWAKSHTGFKLKLREAQ